MPLIPVNNPMALIGYYLGIACLIPVLGFLLALPAFILGVMGVLKAKSQPEVGGMGHAIAAIVLSFLGPGLWVGLFLLASMLRLA